MKLTIEYPDALDAKLRDIAEAEGQTSRNAIIRKAIALFLEDYTRKNKKRAEVRP